MAIRPDFSNFAPDPRNFTIPNSAIIGPGIASVFGNLLSNFQDNRRQIDMLNSYADILGQADPLAAQMMRATAASIPKFSFGGGGSRRGGGYGAGGGSSMGLLSDMLSVANDLRDDRLSRGRMQFGRDLEVEVATEKRNLESEDIQERREADLDRIEAGRQAQVSISRKSNEFKKEFATHEAELKGKYFGVSEEAIKKVADTLLRKREAEVGPIESKAIDGEKQKKFGFHTLAPSTVIATVLKEASNPQLVQDMLRMAEVAVENEKVRNERAKLSGPEDGMRYWGIADYVPLSRDQLQHLFMELKTDKEKAHFLANVGFSLADAGEGGFPYPNRTNPEKVTDLITLGNEWKELAENNDADSIARQLEIQDKLGLGGADIANELLYFKRVENYVMQVGGQEVEGTSSTDPQTLQNRGVVEDSLHNYILRQSGQEAQSVGGYQ